ncbi:MAG: CRTAC1 family protein [Planctomycetota bacterium]|nr:CRTAC1 family protein [Planctomycetota bacterium]
MRWIRFEQLMMAVLLPLGLWMALMGICGCQKDGPVQPSAQNPSKLVSDKELAVVRRDPVFVDATESLGLDFHYDPGPLDDYFFPAIMGGGAAFLDFDNDGDLDVYCVNGNDRRGGEPAATKIQNRLFEQKEDGRFVDVTQRSGLGDRGFGMGVAVGDVNNDGNVDVYVTNYGADQLYVNQGDGCFKKATESAGIDNSRWGVSATFLDYDRDGWLDLYVTNYVSLFAARQCKSRDGRLEFCSPSAFDGTVDRLYRNLGPQADHEVRFQDVTLVSKISSKRGPGLGVVSGDFNGDHWPDLYVANDGAANVLWINQKNGTFSDEAVLRGVAFDRQGQAQAGMGVATGDVNQDGQMDLLVSHLAGESNALYLSSGNQFNEDSVRYGMGVSSFSSTGFGVAWADLEHDGREDVLLVNGRVTRSPLGVTTDGFLGPYAEKNHCLLCQENGRFERMASSTDPFLQGRSVSRALCTGEVDNDGDLDALVINIGSPAKLYLNESKKVGTSIRVTARETSDHGGRIAYGAVVRLMGSAAGNPASPISAIRRVNPGTSYCASSDPRVHFGIPQDTEVQGVEVTWVDGSREWFPLEKGERQTTVTRGEGSHRD